MSNWTYGDAWEKFPIEKGEVWGTDLCTVAVHDIHDPLPGFMLEADLVFVDPPWNTGNCNAFITKNGGGEYIETYTDFALVLLQRISDIAPTTVYLEIGKEYLPWWHMALQARYKYVTFFNSTYYHKADSLCYVIRATNKFSRLKPKLDGMDEEDIIDWVCHYENYKCIADLCMGRGLVGKYASKYGHKSVGTELNQRRLACLLEAINGRKIS